ncbi:MAG: alpha/beta hydrolase [Bdellovibrionales bacterium]|nr:alpha/beta hydrolase [Bdellovibrionales bacterium]
MLRGNLFRLGLALLTSLLLPQVGRAALSQPTASNLIRLPEVRCADEDLTCFESTRAMLESVTDPVDGRFVSPSLKTMASARTSRSQVAVVMFPGLYSDSSQFRVLAAKLDERGYFVMHVSLPGHWGQTERGSEVRSDDWIEESRRAIKIAHVMAKKVVVLGHSMGGMLSINAALTPEFRVDGLIAMEPAVRVRPEIAWPLCNVKYFGDSIGDFPRIKKLVTGNEVTEQDKQRSLNMGCEVTVLRSRVLQQHLSKLARFGQLWGETVALTVPATEAVTELKLSRALGRRLTVPSLFLVNTSDDTVSAGHVVALTTGIKSDVPHRVVTFDGISHGLITLLKFELVESNTIEFLEKL